MGAGLQTASENLDWLYANLHPYFFITMQEEIEAIVNLALALRTIPSQQKTTLIDETRKLMVARPDLPGSLYDTLQLLRDREISYAELIHSSGPIPGGKNDLEIQRFEFEWRTSREIAAALQEVRVPRKIRNTVAAVMKKEYLDFDFKEFDRVLGLLWVNNPGYVRISPPLRIARVMWLYQRGRENNGLYLDVEQTGPTLNARESRILFSVGNPPQRGFLTQISEVFQRLNIGIRRSYSLIVNTGLHPYFLGTFYVSPRETALVEKHSELFQALQSELYNTQILSPTSRTYSNYVSNRLMTGDEASLTNAFIAFCHTTLAHQQPDRFDFDTVERALQTDPEMARRLIGAFQSRFDPDRVDRLETFPSLIEEVRREIAGYHTGNRYLDEIRKTIYKTCLLFIQHTLKTNFFVPEKHALAFRLSPDYLDELDPRQTTDLPVDKPFRITFFFGRHGIGYHIGFSDIARGGWRTIMGRNRDEYITNANTLFRENFVLAHTQHLKNKDIYEGGSKMVVVLDAEDTVSEEAATQRLYKLQYGFINAFLDLFVTQDGKAAHPRVVDYYGEEEPIELGPDENMHDAMIELIARQSRKRGYLLGSGIMSSKAAGINHKEFGVTSRGVVKFSEIAMKALGLDMRAQPFSVKVTGGTNGDVAGNALKLLLERCPQVTIRAIVAGSGALYDPQGAVGEELRRLLLQRDVVEYDPARLHPGGFILFRREKRKEGLRVLHRKLLRTASGVDEVWITSDEFYRENDTLVFSVPVDLFLPCGGRPETIDGGNWPLLFTQDGTPTARCIVEGANSFITPEARDEIQKRGVVLLRDASANKCGVIASSYEILGNLLMTEKEFLAHKNEYVRDVLALLDQRAEDEANLLFRRHGEHSGKRSLTAISDDISTEINGHYARLFAFFQDRPATLDRPGYRRVILHHLPKFVRENPVYKNRVKHLPVKIKCAVLSVEIASTIVYRGDWEIDFDKRLQEYLKRQFA
ncbi:MAG: NAD-glutamate dehydrogenase [Deltaproteobacteria bacterium]|nr:NAD-glutamate dehydrogenase [Deltaproteobacteria bacterium]